MAITVRQLADLVGGTVVGDGELVIQSARTLQEAQRGDVTFLEKPTHLNKLQASQASASIVPRGLVCETKTLIQVADPLMAFVAVVQRFQGKATPKPTGIDTRACVHPGATIGEAPSIAANVHIGAGTTLGKRCRLYPGVVIGENCKLGDDVTLYPNVVLYDDTVLGDRVVIHASAILGADGFGYRFHDGAHHKVPQLGNVVIGNDVEIGAGTAIDRATFGSTVIGDGCKIDNQVQIGHNCKIGKHNVFAAQVGIAGSSTTGAYVVMAGQVGIADHIHVGDGAILGAQTGIHSDVPPRARMIWAPAFEEHEAWRLFACLRKLPAMRKDVMRILKELQLDQPETEAPAA